MVLLLSWGRHSSQMRPIARIAIGVSLIVITACGDKRAPSAPTPTTHSVSAIALIPQSVFGVGRETRVRASATFATGETSDVTDLASWQSSDISIVEVAPRGIARSRAEGSALISATYQGVTGSRRVTTQKCVSWNIQGPPVIWLGQSVNWRTDAYDGCIPHWTSVAARWESGATHIAEIKPPRFPMSSSVTITGLSPGTAFIVAKSDDGASLKSSEATGTITVLSVRRPPPAVLEIRYPEDGVAVGRTLELRAYGYWHTPIEWFEEVTAVAQWKSSNRTIATVSSSGLVTGHATGKVIISASVDGVREDVPVVVSAAR